MTLGQRIQQIRIEHSLSQEEFAEKLGTTRQTVSRWELDQTFPEIAKVVLISKVFSVSTDSILKDGISTFDTDVEYFTCGVYRGSNCEIVETEKFALVFYCSSDKNILGTKLYKGYENKKRLVAICERNKIDEKTEYAYFVEDSDPHTAISNSERMTPKLGEVYDSNAKKSMRRLESFVVDHSGTPLPTVAGHLQEKKGYFYMVLNFTVNGKRQTKWIPTGLAIKGNKKRAEAMLMETRQTFIPPADTLIPSSGEMMFTDFMKMWLEVAKSTIKLTTYASYAAIVNNRIVPYFEPKYLRLSEVTANDIQKFYLWLLEQMTANSVIHYHAVIHRAMKYAVKTDLIVANPVDKVDRPKRTDYHGSFYNEEEMQDLFEAVKGSKLELPVMLSAFYGLRRSEVLGLKWDAIDFQQNTITIKHTITSCKVDGKLVEVASDTTKTKSSRRTLPLVPQFRDMLRQRWEMQEEYKRVCGKCYNREFLDYVCVDEMGNIIRPNYLTTSFQVLLEKNGMRKIRFHDLRHTCASLLLKNGVPMKQIQEWLGHSDFSTTANIYAHLDYNSKLNSADAMISGMSGALNFVS